MSRLWCELALIDGRPRADVLIEVAAGRISSITVGADRGDATRLPGFTIPGLANAHSHAFHRALRSRTQAGRGTFWTWRTLMYRAAERLRPDTYHRLARAVFAEMASAGMVCVGEFHYLHHEPDGTAYGDRNAMGEALLAAADEVGIRLTLLDTLYLHGGLGRGAYQEASGVQRRFSDGTVEGWIDRVDRLAGGASSRIGAALHSVRAVDPVSMEAAADWAAAGHRPLHAHVSEQPAENQACLDHHGTTPLRLMADRGVLSDRFSAVHGTHVEAAEVELLAAAGSTVVMCPTTERDLGDGVGPTDRFADAGVAIAIGSDSHAVIDPFEEARAVELDQRLDAGARGLHTPGELLAMATVHGHRSLGWDDAGAIAVGNRADLVTVSLESVRTAGVGREFVVEATVFAATASDVTDVHVDGRRIVADGRHVEIDVVDELNHTIEELMNDD